MKYAAKKIAAMLLTMVIVSLLAFTAFSLISFRFLSIAVSVFCLKSPANTDNPLFRAFPCVPFSFLALSIAPNEIEKNPFFSAIFMSNSFHAFVISLHNNLPS